MGITELRTRSYSASAELEPVLRMVCGDSRTHILRLIVPRSPDGVDLSGLAWTVHTVNAEGVTDVYFCTGITVEENVIRMDWLLQGTATAAAGRTRFELAGGRETGEGTQLVWQSDTYCIELLESLGSLTIAPPDDGSVGDVLTRTAGGVEWLPAPNVEGLPNDGTPGQVVTMTEDGLAWRDPPAGSTGGYYIPSVDDGGMLSWTPSNPAMEAVSGANIRGAAGHSPVRGTDYWTPSDVAEIKAYVDGAILNGSW